MGLNKARRYISKKFAR